MDYELAQLIEASRMLTERQKDAIIKLLEQMPLGDKVKLKKAFLTEHEVLQNHYHQLNEIKKNSAEKKIRIIYSHTERMVEIAEEKEIDALEDELNSISA